MHMCYDSDEHYSNNMVKEAIRVPTANTTISGLTEMFSSTISNFRIILWALKENWSYEDEYSNIITVEEYARILNTHTNIPYEDSKTNAYIQALYDPNYTSPHITEDVMQKIAQITTYRGYAINTNTNDVHANVPIDAQNVQHKHIDFFEATQNFLTDPTNIAFLVSGMLTVYGAVLMMQNQYDE